MISLNKQIVKDSIEQLEKGKRIPLKDIVTIYKTGTGGGIKSGSLLKKGGVYVFWWTGSFEYFKTKINRVIPKKGPNERVVNITISDEWLDSYPKEICLYVGKNADNLQSRIGQHLRLGSKRDSEIGKNVLSGKAPTTVCQLKNGIEKLFLEESNIRQLILENISFSYLTLNGDKEAINRFYIEDLAIGHFFPILNMDIER